MPRGIRVTHPARRNAFYVIADPNRPFKIPPEGLSPCPTCNMVHFYKTYHILLNGDGAAVVSDGVFEGLKSAGAFAPSNPDRLEIESETTNPPKVVLGLGNGGMAPIPQRDEVVIYHE